MYMMHVCVLMSILMSKYISCFHRDVNEQNNKKEHAQLLEDKSKIKTVIFF